MRLLFFLILLSGSIACTKTSRKQIILATGPVHSTNYEIGEAIAQLLRDKLPDYRILLDTSGDGSYARCNQLNSGRADFALVQNDVQLSPEATDSIRIVLSVYPQILFVIHRKDVHEKSLRALFNGRRIGVGPHASGVHTFVQEMMRVFKIDAAKSQLVYSAYDDNYLRDSIDVSVSLTGFNAQRIERMLTTQEGALWSFDAVSNLGKGSAADAFTLQYPYARPFIVPRGLYQSAPEEPALTLAIDNILVARADMDQVIVFDIVSAILNNKGRLAARNTLCNSILTPEDNRVSRFAVHDGVHQYVDRDKPGVIERHSELLQVLLAIAGVLGSLIIGWFQYIGWKRNRLMEKYSTRLFDIQRRLEFTYDDPERLLTIEADLKSLWKESIQAVRERKLSINEHYMPFQKELKAAEDELHLKKIL